MDRRMFREISLDRRAGLTHKIDASTSLLAIMVIDIVAAISRDWKFPADVPGMREVSGEDGSPQHFRAHWRGRG